MGGESPKGVSKEVADVEISGAQTGPADGATATVIDGGKVVPPKKNRSGAEKRKARRARLRAPEGPQPGPSAPSVTPEQRQSKTTGNKRQISSNDTPPSDKHVAKKHRAREKGIYAETADPLTRVIVAEGYPDKPLGAERLALLRGAVSREIDGILEGPVPRFCSTYLRAGAAVVTCADEESLSWLTS